MVCRWTQKLPLVIVVSLGLVSLSATEITMDGASFVELGEMMQLTCSATAAGASPTNIEWFKDGIKLHSYNNRVLITKHLSLMSRSFISVLYIDRSMYEDAGTYTCRTNAPVQVDSMKVMILERSLKVERTPAFTDVPVVDYTETGSGCVTTQAALMLLVIALVLEQSIL